MHAVRSVPVLMLTGARDGERQGLESGADDYLAKPFDFDELQGDPTLYRPKFITLDLE